MLDINTNSLYREVIMEHYKHPQNRGLKQNLKKWVIKNPTCGDSLTVQIELKNNVISNIYHEGIGCSISLSSASIMSEALKGKTVEEGIYFIHNFVHMVKGEAYDAALDFKDAVVYGNLADYPARFKCGTVAWEVVLRALNEIKDNKNI
jgi:nitrogen fixation NifU-like protein